MKKVSIKISFSSNCSSNDELYNNNANTTVRMKKHNRETQNNIYGQNNDTN